MKAVVLALAMSLSMVATTPPAYATGAETLHLKFNGQFAEAVFQFTDGCIRTSVYVLATDQRSASSQAVIELFQTDSCSGTLLISASGSAVLAPDQFQIDTHLDAATLNAAVEVTDFVSTSVFSVDVSVSWTGSGDRVKVTDTFHLEEPGFRRNGHFNGTLRSATASGDLSGGIINFTSQPATFADMGSVRRAEVTILH